MTKVNHTPGPWEVSYWDRHGQRVVKSQHIEVCTCWHHSALEGEMEANARLISVSPTLLAYAELEEVLGPQSTREQIEEVFRKHGYDESMMQPHSMRVFMNGLRNEAIAKALSPLRPTASPIAKTRGQS